MSRVTNSKNDFKEFLDVPEDLGLDYFVIGGLATNSYTEPLVTLDLI